MPPVWKYSYVRRSTLYNAVTFSAEKSTLKHLTEKNARRAVLLLIAQRTYCYTVISTIFPSDLSACGQPRQLSATAMRADPPTRLQAPAAQRQGPLHSLFFPFLLACPRSDGLPNQFLSLEGKKVIASFFFSLKYFLQHLLIRIICVYIYTTYCRKRFHGPHIISTAKMSIIHTMHHATSHTDEGPRLPLLSVLASLSSNYNSTISYCGTATSTRCALSGRYILVQAVQVGWVRRIWCGAPRAGRRRKVSVIARGGRKGKRARSVNSQINMFLALSTQASKLFGIAKKQKQKQKNCNTQDDTKGSFIIFTVDVGQKECHIHTCTCTVQKKNYSSSAHIMRGLAHVLGRRSFDLRTNSPHVFIDSASLRCGQYIESDHKSDRNF